MKALNHELANCETLPGPWRRLGACASLQGLEAGPYQSGGDRFAQIHPGLTQDEVRSLAGGPGTVTGASRSGEMTWIYSFTDTWGYRFEFDVVFNASGVVTDTYSERLDY
jgi:hypothetical protein